MKRLILYLLAALVAGALLFGWGYRRGVASVVVRDSISVQLKPLPPITVTVREPWPIAVREPSDTVWENIPVDTGAIIADYLRTRDYHFDFSSDSTGQFIVDASVSRNRLTEITPTIVPIVREIERVHTVTQTVAKRNRFAVIAGVGVGYTPQGLQSAVGVQVGVVLWGW